ncbi:hypothetical protein B0H11DRAFT_203485 [Mycena galericulata]|nr:hypothetical protein B0H11DRAFT_203485 [Mycena galericulata]
MTLQLLHSLALNCSRLESLQLDFDARTIPASGSTRVVHNSLEWVHVASSLISNAAPVARYLSSIFPNLSEIYTACEYEDNDDPEEVPLNADAIAAHRLWKQVEVQIPEFVAARAEEHVWGPA